MSPIVLKKKFLTQRLSFSLLFLISKIIQENKRFYIISTMAEKIVNYNKRLFGPGPVARLPAPGIRGFYARMPPLKGFSYAAAHGTLLGFAIAFAFKVGYMDADTRAIKQYYEENPPR
jgi:hypothetical protein